VIAAEGPDARFRFPNQVVHHRRRNVVAEEGGVERAGVTTRAHLEPLALHDAVVERGIRVERARIGVVQRLVGPTSIRLIAARRKELAILAVTHLDGFAVRQRNRREARVGRRQCRVGVMRHTAQPA
jgi:hypothetical protein